MGSTHPHERVLRQFGMWHHLVKMRAKAARQPLTDNARTYAVLEVNRAVDFCAWLAEHNLPLDQLTQPALDRYYPSLSSAYQQSLCGFLNWAIRTRRRPRLRFIRPRFRVGEALTQQRRLELLRDLLTATDKPLAHRVAGCILLLFAQPVPRILALELDDVIRTDDEVQLRMGTPPIPVPEPFATLLLQLVDTRTAAGSDQWLFTGRSAGRPMCHRGLANHLRTLGIPLRPPAPLRSANSSSTSPHPSSRTRWASTTPPPTARTPTPAAPGTGTSPPDLDEAPFPGAGSTAQRLVDDLFGQRSLLAAMNTVAPASQCPRSAVSWDYQDCHTPV